MYEIMVVDAIRDTLDAHEIGITATQQRCDGQQENSDPAHGHLRKPPEAGRIPHPEKLA
jgi:hypothetical protein